MTRGPMPEAKPRVQPKRIRSHLSTIQTQRTRRQERLVEKLTRCDFRDSFKRLLAKWEIALQRFFNPWDVDPRGHVREKGEAESSIAEGVRTLPCELDLKTRLQMAGQRNSPAASIFHLCDALFCLDIRTLTYDSEVSNPRSVVLANDKIFTHFALSTTEQSTFKDLATAGSWYHRFALAFSLGSLILYLHHLEECRKTTSMTLIPKIFSPLRTLIQQVIKPTRADVAAKNIREYQLCDYRFQNSLSSHIDVQPPERIGNLSAERQDSPSSPTANQPVNRRLAGLISALQASGCVNSVPESILQRGYAPQPRWNSDGNSCEITLVDSGLDRDLVDTISAKENLARALSQCLDAQLLVKKANPDGSSSYSVSSELGKEAQAFKMQCLLFVIHIFPRAEALLPGSSILGKMLLPYLERLWTYALGDDCVLHKEARESLIDATLEATRWTRPEQTHRAFSVLEQVLTEDTPAHLNLAYVAKRSAMLRSRGRDDSSEEMLAHIPPLVFQDIRSYCEFGLVLLSRAENAIMRKEFDRAREHLDTWTPNDPASLFELRIIRQKNTLLGRVLRYQGDFDRAAYCFKKCLQPAITEKRHLHILHHLGDVYCEQGLPKKAQKLVSPEVGPFGHVKASKTHRRLLLTLAEASIIQRCHDQAKSLAKECDLRFTRMSDLDVSDQMTHARSLFMLARVAVVENQWSEATRMSDRLIDLLECYPTFADGNFYIGMVYLLRAVIFFQCGDLTRCQEAISQAHQCDQVPRFFMPGLGTYVLEEWRRSLEPYLAE